MNEEFVEAIRQGLDRGLTLLEFLPILREFRDRGMTSDTAERLIVGMLVDVDDSLDERIREIGDVAGGFCSPHLRVWPTAPYEPEA